MEDRRHWNCHIQCAERRKTVNHGFHIQLKYPSKNEDKIRTFLDNKNREFVTRRLPLQKKLKKVFQAEGQ